MDFLNNLDLLSVGITIAAIGILGFTVYFNDRRSVTNRTFFLLSLAVIAWSIVNYFTYQTQSSQIILWLLRAVMFFAVWFAFFIFRFFYVFPEKNVAFNRIYKIFILPLTLLVSLLTLTPFTFKEVAELAPGGGAGRVVNGPGIIFFGITVLVLNGGGIFLFLKKALRYKKKDRRPYEVILSGILITLSLILVFNFLYPAFFNMPQYIPLSALFIFPFIAFTSYSILKHRIFNIKVVGTAFLTFALAVVTFAEIIFADDITLILFRSSIFLLVLIVGINLIRGVFREVSTREKIQTLAAELKDANDQQSELLYFITHQIKGFFTNTKGALSMIMEGDYGPVPEPIAQVVKEVYGRESKGVDMVQGFLNASKIEQGQMEYVMKPFDAKALVTDIVGDQKSAAEAKGLMLETKLEEGDFTITGDRIQLREAFFNLVDNAVRYTPQGTVTVGLEKRDGKTVYWVKDTGVGIDPDDRSKLFTKYGHGKDSRKVNVNSNGIGLYTVKKIIEAHKGRVWVESEGPGKGSTFYIELV